MPQGTFKGSKQQLPNASKNKGKHDKKVMGLKKGARDIAPKKTRCIEATKVHKELEKAIRMNVVKKMVQASDAQAEQSAAKSKKSAHSKQNSKSTS